MKKKEFLKELESRLNGLPEEDIKARLQFYEEMIDDRMEEGKTEEEAVADIGTIDAVVEDIAKDTPLLTLVKERVKPKRNIKAWEIVLIAVGFPIWLPLLIVAFVLLIVGYILLWILAIVSYAVETALIGAIIYGYFSFFASGFNYGYLAIGIIATGLSIFMMFGCIGATKLNIKLTKAIALSIKKKIVSRS